MYISDVIRFNIFELECSHRLTTLNKNLSIREVFKRYLNRTLQNNGNNSFQDNFEHMVTIQLEKYLKYTFGDELQNTMGTNGKTAFGLKYFSKHCVFIKIIICMCQTNV